jgi:hypothetical protein
MTWLQPRKPSASMIVALIALFVALGGSSYAAVTLAKNSVGSKQLKKNAVTTPKIKNGAVTAGKINPAGLTVPNATHASSADSALQANAAANSSQLGGIAAKHYPHPGSVLASGDTETGVFAGQAGGGGMFNVPIAFEPQLAAAPAHYSYLSPASTSSSCPGVGHAAAGYLCMYAGYAFASSLDCIGSPGKACSGGPDATGAVAFFNTSQNNGDVMGNWAYTAP